MGAGGNAKRLRETHADEADARAAAQEDWQRIQRGRATFGLQLAPGRPELFPEQPARVTGFKPEIDDTA